MRYRLTPAKRAPHRVDYTAEALADFHTYAIDVTISPDLRESAAEIYRQIQRNQRGGAFRNQEGR